MDKITLNGNIINDLMYECDIFDETLIATILREWTFIPESLEDQLISEFEKYDWWTIKYESEYKGNYSDADEYNCKIIMKSPADQYYVYNHRTSLFLGNNFPDNITLVKVKN